MGSDFVEVYSNSELNAQINASSSGEYGNLQSGRDAKRKYGSYNSLILSYSDSKEIDILLDGLSTRLAAKLIGAGAFSIKPEDGIYFDFVEVQNKDAAAAISASKLNIRYAISLKKN